MLLADAWNSDRDAHVPSVVIVVGGVNEAVAVGGIAGTEAVAFHSRPPRHHGQKIKVGEVDPILRADQNVAQVEVTITIAILVQNTMWPDQLLSLTGAHFGNVAGPEYDLSPDGKFKGQTISVLQLYTGEGLDFMKPKAAPERKGFAVNIWTTLPPVDEFVSGLKRSCQLWVISGRRLSVTPDHIAAIQVLVNLKKGLFLWEDNDPFNKDASVILAGLTHTPDLSLAVRARSSGHLIGGRRRQRRGVTFVARRTLTTAAVVFRKLG